MQFRYNQNQNHKTWFKGNTHIHSTVSDGALDFAQLAQRYAGAGYAFLCRTDHWTASRADADPAEYPLLWLDGVELDGRDAANVYFHIVCLGTFDGIERGMELERALSLSARAKWSGDPGAPPLDGKFPGGCAAVGVRWGGGL